MKVNKLFPRAKFYYILNATDSSHKCLKHSINYYNHCYNYRQNKTYIYSNLEINLLLPEFISYLECIPAT